MTTNPDVILIEIKVKNAAVYSFENGVYTKIIQKNLGKDAKKVLAEYKKNGTFPGCRLYELEDGVYIQKSEDKGECKTITVSSKPKPAAAKPKPAAAKPKPAASKPKPVASKPKPAASKPKPAASKPKPAASKPKPAASKPDASDAFEDDSSELGEVEKTVLSRFRKLENVCADGTFINLTGKGVDCYKRPPKKNRLKINERHVVYGSEETIRKIENFINKNSPATFTEVEKESEEDVVEEVKEMVKKTSEKIKKTDGVDYEALKQLYEKLKDKCSEDKWINLTGKGIDCFKRPRKDLKKLILNGRNVAYGDPDVINKLEELIKKKSPATSVEVQDDDDVEEEFVEKVDKIVKDASDELEKLKESVQEDFFADKEPEKMDDDEDIFADEEPEKPKPVKKSAKKLSADDESKQIVEMFIKCLDKV